jgi:secreted trypsin-like serine protease
MRKRLVAIAIVLAGALMLPISPAGAITYGRFDHQLHPNVGSLLVKNKRGRYLQLCTVSVVAPDVVLTAAHCVQGAARPDIFWVTFDPVLSQDMETIHGVAHYDRRAYTQGEANPHDIAVVILDRPVDVQPVDLPPIGFLDRLQRRHGFHDQLFTAVGYGARRTTQQGGFQGILGNRKRRYALQHAQALQNQWIQLSMNPATGNAGTCYGDSGGPHFLGGVDSNLEVALTVTGDAVCKATDKDFRLDTRAAQNFLARYIDLG